MTARIVWKDEGWHLVNGTPAGRMKTDEILWTLDFLKDPDFTLDAVCTDSLSYLAIKRVICAATDISYSGPDDGSAPCDATSWAWEFTAEPARLAGVRTQPPFPYNCPPETAPANDRCSTLD